MRCFLPPLFPCGAGETLFEAGIGTGVAALCVAARVPSIHVTGIEIASRYAHAVPRKTPSATASATTSASSTAM